MLGTGKISLIRWTDGELNDHYKNTTPDGWTDIELNDQHQNTTPDRYTNRELNGGHKNNHK